MILPYGDSITTGKLFSGVSSLIAAMCLLDIPGFLNPEFEWRSVHYLGFVPVFFSLSPWSHFYSTITASFLHGDVFHLLGNCLFLWVFGRSLERLFGLPLFIVSFPFLGIVGFLVHWTLFPDSASPVIGASGAIATLMGAYLALFPAAKVQVVLVLGVAFKRIRLPAWTFLFYWAGLQILSLALGNREDHVAYAVHIGGFVAGAICAMIWKVSYPFAEERLSNFVQAAIQR